MVALRALDAAGRHGGVGREARERVGAGAIGRSLGAPPPQRTPPPPRRGGGEGSENKRPTAPTARLGSAWRSRPGPQGARSRRRSHCSRHRADRATARFTQPRGPLAAFSSALAGLYARENPSAAGRAGTPASGDQGREKEPRGAGAPRSPRRRRRRRFYPLLTRMATNSPQPHPAPGTASQRSGPGSCRNEHFHWLRGSPPELE
ncbi:uncharacterized protein [Macaca fascicularis]|uniref:uncharacterized protein n=1 Tax=Macaca fascicularis TaxID=9541 RepID=UPI003D15816A